MSGDDVIKILDNLEKDERDKVLAHVIQKYFIDIFFVGNSWWFTEKNDDIYDELYDDSKNGVAPPTQEESKQ